MSSSVRVAACFLAIDRPTQAAASAPTITTSPTGPPSRASMPDSAVPSVPADVASVTAAAAPRPREAASARPVSAVTPCTTGPMLSATARRPLASAWLTPLVCMPLPTYSSRALLMAVKPPPIVSPAALASARSWGRDLASACTITAEVSLPSSAIFFSSPRATPMPSANAISSDGAASATELNSSPPSLPAAMAWLNCWMAEPASAALAPSFLSAAAIDSARTLTSLRPPPSGLMALVSRT